MQLAKHSVRFSLGSIPVVGNTVTGTIIGLTQEGAAFCDEMMVRSVSRDDVPACCEDLASSLTALGFLVEDSAAARPSISGAYLHVTNCCNLHCVGCYSANESRNRVSDPTLKDLTRAVKSLADLGVERLVISGGEPLFRNDLMSIARCAKANGITRVVILSNGMACTHKRLADLSDCVDEISVSFDGVSADKQAYVRGTQHFDTLVKAVKDIRAANIEPHIISTLHAKNIEDVPQYLALGERLGATVGFSLLSGGKSELGDLYPSESCLACLAATMFEHNASSGDDVIANAKKSGLSAHVSCGAGRTGVSVAADGFVYPCHMLHYPMFCLGNAFRDSPDQLREALAKFSLPVVDEIAGCSSCDKRYLCGGGCRARAYRECGEIGKKDPYCVFYHHFIHAAVDEFNSVYR